MLGVDDFIFSVYIFLYCRLEMLEKKIQECLKIEKDGAKKAAELEKKMKNIKSLRETELKNAENEMNKWKKKSDQSREAWQKREQVCLTIHIGLHELPSLKIALLNLRRSKCLILIFLKLYFRAMRLHIWVISSTVS